MVLTWIKVSFSAQTDRLIWWILVFFLTAARANILFFYDPNLHQQPDDHLDKRSNGSLKCFWIHNSTETFPHHNNLANSCALPWPVCSRRIHCSHPPPILDTLLQRFSPPCLESILTNAKKKKKLGGTDQEPQNELDGKPRGMLRRGWIEDNWKKYLIRNYQIKIL